MPALAPPFPCAAPRFAPTEALAISRQPLLARVFSAAAVLLAHHLLLAAALAPPTALDQLLEPLKQSVEPTLQAVQDQQLEAAVVRLVGAIQNLAQLLTVEPQSAYAKWTTFQPPCRRFRCAGFIFTVGSPTPGH